LPSQVDRRRAIRCLRLLGDIIASARFDIATLSVALLEIRSSRTRAPPSPIPGNHDTVTEPGISDGRRMNRYRGCVVYFCTIRTAH
jgi:hypothetical protein